MAGYIAVVSADMDALHSELSASINALVSAVTAEAEAVNTLISTNNMSGNTATRMKNYMIVVHGTILNDILQCCETLSKLWECYRQEYRNQVDNAGVVYISSGELANIKSRFASFVQPTDSCVTAIRNAISSVSDISAAASFGTDRWFQEIFTAYQNSDGYIDDLNDRIESIESKYKGHATLSTIRDKIRDLLQMINEYYGKQNMHWTDFDATAAMQTPLYQRLEASSQELDKTLIDIDAAAKEAIAAEEAHFTKAQQEIELDNLLAQEQRRQQVAWKKGFATVVTLAVDAVVIIGTAGMGAPAVIAVNTLAGGLTLGLSNATDSAVDQYINDGSIDYNEVVYEGTKGAVVGSTTSAITSGVGQYVKGLKETTAIKNVLKPATDTFKSKAAGAVLGFGIDLSFGLAKSGSKGVVKRFETTLIDDLHEGKDFGDSMSDAVKSGFDSRESARDMAKSAAGTVVDTVFDGVTSKIPGLSGSSTPETYTRGEILSVSIKNGWVAVPGAIVGSIAEDTVDYFTDSSEDKEGYVETVFTVGKISKSALSALVMETAKTEAKEQVRQTDAIEQIREQQELDQLEKDIAAQLNLRNDQAPPERVGIEGAEQEARDIHDDADELEQAINRQLSGRNDDEDPRRMQHQVNEAGSVVGAESVHSSSRVVGFDVEAVRDLFKPAKDQAVFWSGEDGYSKPDGMSEAEYAEERKKFGGEKAALEYARKSGGETLEMMMERHKQALIDAGFPYDREKGEFIWNEDTKPAWDQLSQVYAESATGRVRVVFASDEGSTLREDSAGNPHEYESTWASREFPSLSTNPNVSSITAIDPYTGEEETL